MHPSKLFKPFVFIYNFVINLVFPPRCIICDGLYAKRSFKDNIFLCDDCREKIRFIDDFPSQCKKCSRPISENDILCPGCQVVRHSYDVAFSCTIYEKEMRRSLLSYKFGSSRYKYRTYAQIMTDRVGQTAHFPKSDMIVSVPLSKNRKKRRGFDHVVPLAKYISYVSDVPYEKNAVFKIKDTLPQSKLSFKERFMSVKGAYKANDKTDFKGKSILLIDDIYTTGATVSEISSIMKKKGAKYVTVLTLCITPGIER